MNRFLLFIFFSSVFVFTLFPQQEVGEETHNENASGEKSLNALQLLNDALLMNIKVEIKVPETDKELWNTRIEKITIPGRPVEVSLKGGNSQLKVHFTLYPAGGGKKLFMVAQNETWVDSDYSSSISSLTVLPNEDVYYYPLGKADNKSGDNPVEVIMKINIVPYLESLDKETRRSLQSVFSSSAQFSFQGRKFD